MITESELYFQYSIINPYNNFGLKNYLKRENNGVYYYIPEFLSKNTNSKWIASFRLERELPTGVTKQIYYDLVVLGIDNPSKRPKCKFCGEEATFSLDYDYRGYRDYCTHHKYKHIAEINSKLFKGVPLKPEHIKKLSLAKKGKKLTPEQLKRRPRGYHFKHSEATKQKLSASKKGKTISRSYYKSGKYTSKKCTEELTYLSSYELDFLKICDSNKYIKSIEVPDPIQYKLSGKVHHYYPDFLLTLDSNQKVIVEIKCLNQVNDPIVIAKRIAAKTFCYKNKLKYITLTELDIYLDKKHKILNNNILLYDYFY